MASWFLTDKYLFYVLNTSVYSWQRLKNSFVTSVAKLKVDCFPCFSMVA